MEDSPAYLASQAHQKTNLALRLWEGDVPLPITYWVFWALIGGGIGGIVSALVEHNYAAIITSPSGLYLVDAFFWLLIAYTAFIIVAIWRSAGKHTGSAFWAGAARVMAVFGAMAIIVNVSTRAGLIPGDDGELRKEIESINRGLPVMLDEITRMDRVEIVGRDIHFIHTLTSNPDEMNYEAMESAMRPSLIGTVCGDPQVLSHMKDGRRLSYLYSDELGPAMEITVSVSDCNL